MIIGIDASNIRSGGGVVHLVELLHTSNPDKHKFDKIIVWASQSTLDLIIDCKWIIKCSDTVLDQNNLFCLIWQWKKLGELLKKEECTMLLVPGGTLFTRFKPTVVMSQNLLPFEWKEINRYGFRLFAFKLLILRLVQSYSFKLAGGVIFLTEHAKNTTISVIKKIEADTNVISHGIDNRFYCKPRNQKDISCYSMKKPFKLIYISPLEPYKHHLNVVIAVYLLRKKGFPVVLDMYGSPSRLFIKNKLDKVIQKYDPNSLFLKYHGIINHKDIQEKYIGADVAIFASSCETFGQILLEGMASGLPTVCSSMSAMQEILGENGDYFNPLNVDSIVVALQKTIESVDNREKYAWGGYEASKSYSWRKCADETFSFINKVAEKHRVLNSSDKCITQ